MTLPRHHGTPSTLPPGQWCDAAVASDGKLEYVAAYCCAGCGWVRVLFNHAVSDAGVVSPDVRCHTCGTTQTLTLEHWDDDPC